MKRKIPFCIALMLASAAHAQNIEPLAVAPAHIVNAPPVTRLPLQIHRSASSVQIEPEFGGQADGAIPASDPVQAMSQLYGQLPQAADPGKGCTVTVDSEMPLLPGWRHYFVTPIVIDQQPLMMLVDSGASRTALSPQTISALHLARDPNERRRTRGVDGVSETEFASIVPTLHFGSVNIENFDVSTVSMVQAGQTSQDGAIPVGLVGNDLLSRFDVEFDFPNHQIRLYRVSGCSGRFVPWTGHYDAFMATHTANGGLVIPIVLNGTVMHALIDTGSSRVNITDASARTLGIDAQTLANDPATNSFGPNGNVVTTHSHRFETVTIGSATFRNARVSVENTSLSGFDVLLGMNFLRSRKVWLSYKTGQVFIQYNGRTPPAPPPGSLIPQMPS